MKNLKYILGVGFCVAGVLMSKTQVGEKETRQDVQVAAIREMAGSGGKLKYHEIQRESETSGQNSGKKERQEAEKALVQQEDDRQAVLDILLVNKENPLPEDYRPGRLKKLPDGVNRAAVPAWQPLCDMLAAGQKEGLVFEICSSYRDKERQEELFEEDVRMWIRKGYSREQAYEKVAEQTMPPGCSEHATGLAFDIVARSYQMLDAGQEQTAENQWLQQYCAEYGFILRYPKDKEEITGISYESWHFRYVGKEAAMEITERGITLEEYLLKSL